MVGVCAGTEAADHVLREILGLRVLGRELALTGLHREDDDVMHGLCVGLELQRLDVAILGEDVLRELGW